MFDPPEPRDRGLSGWGGELYDECPAGWKGGRLLCDGVLCHSLGRLLEKLSASC